MKRVTDRRPTAATVISCVALFVSLGGVSYGVSTGFIDSREIEDESIRSKDLRNNSIRTQDLRNNQVRGRDIRNSTVISRDVGLNSLTGSDIMETSLETVPRADTLDGIDSAGFVRADSVGFAAIPLGPGGGNAAGEPVAQFDVDPFGYAHLEGVVVSDGPIQALATLPPGARPGANKRFVAYSEPGTARVTVQPDGDIVSDAPVNDQLSLDGIIFRVAD